MFCSQWFFVHMLTSLLEISFIFEKNEILMPHVTDWTLWGQKKVKLVRCCFCLFVIFVFVLFSQKLIFQFQLARKSMFLWKKRSLKKPKKRIIFSSEPSLFLIQLLRKSSKKDASCWLSACCWPPARSWRCCSVRRPFGDPRWYLLSEQIWAAAKGKLSHAGDLVPTTNQSVPVHSAGSQCFRLLSSLFPLMPFFPVSPLTLQSGQGWPISPLWLC